MNTGDRRSIAITATVLALVPGCTTPGPLTAHRTALGSLRTNVAQLEHQNEQLKRELADLQVENRRVADRLEQEEATNGELAAKLDDARSALRGDGNAAVADSAPSTSRRRDEPRITPSARPSRSTRRPPFARIPNRIEDEPSEDRRDEPSDDAKDLPAPRRRGEDLGPQSFLDRPSRWLPVGSGAKALR